MSRFVDPTSGSVEHCEAMANQFPDLAESYYNVFASYCQQKLWHQLTLLVLDFLSNRKVTLRPISNAAAAVTEAAMNDKNTFLGLYHRIVLPVSQKLNPLALARIAAEVALWSLDPLAGGMTTVTESKTLLEQLVTKVHLPPATLYLQSKIGLLTLTKEVPPTSEQLASIYATIKANADLLHQLMLPDTPEAMLVHAAHYEMSMTYYKIVGPPEAFYEEAMRYLNYYQPTEDTKSQQHQLAVDVCLAALTGEGVYNLGQVVTNPFLQCLMGTSEAWLVDLLTSCAKGNVAEFKRLVFQTYATQIASQPALVNMSHAMTEKMTLLALVQMVFECPPSQRTLEFTDIAERLEIPFEQVEWVVMRAFSVQLMQGSMDQVEGTVHITWLLPHVLTTDQMSELAQRFGDWAEKVSTIKTDMEQQIPTLTT